MEYRDYVERLRRWESVATISQYGQVDEAGQTHPLLCLTTSGS